MNEGVAIRLPFGEFILGSGGSVGVDNVRKRVQPRPEEEVIGQMPVHLEVLVKWHNMLQGRGAQPGQRPFGNCQEEDQQYNLHASGEAVNALVKCHS